ncbi:MAG: response regulator transcription factor [Lachnospiraceae bacterium]|nr:response regulator transcription factor [Lachnospiraceae bacterium]
MLRIAVCDDEEYFRVRMEHIISEYMDKMGFDYVVNCFESGEAFLETGSQNFDYNIVFLDVNMKEMNGIETAKAIRKLMPDTYIVFVTAYITYSLEGYTVNAIRYILKEDDSIEMAVKECLDTIIGRMNYKETKYTFDFQNGKKDLIIDRILYVESRLHKVFFFVLDDGIVEYYMYDKLDSIEEKLSQFGFHRIHQSFLVNMRYVKKIERYKVILLNKLELSISKKYYKEIETKYVRSIGDI